MEPDIKFKPLTEGLGFHPFSSGFPYSPQQPGGKPLKTASILRSKPSIESISLHHSPSSSLSLDTHSASVQQSSLPLVTPDLDFDYLLRRGIAYLLDTAFNFSICSAAIFIALEFIGIPLSTVVSAEGLSLFVLFLFGFSWALILAQEVALQTSLAKRFYRLKLDGKRSMIFLRGVCFLMTPLSFGLNLLWSLWDKQKRCPHDIWTGIQPHESTRF